MWEENICLSGQMRDFPLSVIIVLAPPELGVSRESTRRDCRPDSSSNPSSRPRLPNHAAFCGRRACGGGRAGGDKEECTEEPIKEEPSYQGVLAISSGLQGFFSLKQRRSVSWASCSLKFSFSSRVEVYKNSRKHHTELKRWAGRRHFFR